MGTNKYFRICLFCVIWKIVPILLLAVNQRRACRSIINIFIVQLVLPLLGNLIDASHSCAGVGNWNLQLLYLWRTVEVFEVTSCVKSIFFLLLFHTSLKSLGFCPLMHRFPQILTQYSTWKFFTCEINKRQSLGVCLKSQVCYLYYAPKAPDCLARN